jgi:hypothetical protein
MLLGYSPTKNKSHQPKTNHMNKLKYLAAVLIAIAGFGLQQASATFISDLTMSNGQGPGFYGSVTVNLDVLTQTATIQFDANTAGGFFFIDGGAAAVNLTGNSATAAFFSEAPTNQFKDFTFDKNNDGFGKFTVRLNNQDAANQVSQIIFTVTNTSGTPWTADDNVLAFNSQGFDASAHYIDNNIGAPNTFFAGEGQGTITVPDGGTAVMLLGVALGALGMARRYLKS